MRDGRRICLFALICLLTFGFGAASVSASALAGTAEKTVTVTAEKKAAKKKSKKNGLVKENGRWRYYKKGVLQKSKWMTIKGRRYYFSKYGNALVGSVKVGKNYRVFNGYGQLLQPKKLKIIYIASGDWCVDNQGRPRPGWQVIGRKLYYINKNGSVRKNATVKGFQLTKKGWAKSSTNTSLKIESWLAVSRVTNSKMSKSQKLYACWRYVVTNFRYASKYPNMGQSGWQRSLALNMLQTHSGNCYGFACAFAALAKEIGYDPIVMCGRVPGSRDGAADGYTRHAWVKINGLHYDPEAAWGGWASTVYASPGYPHGYATSSVRFW